MWLWLLVIYLIGAAGHVLCVVLWARKNVGSGYAYDVGRMLIEALLWPLNVMKRLSFAITIKTMKTHTKKKLIEMLQDMVAQEEANV